MQTRYHTAMLCPPPNPIISILKKKKILCNQMTLSLINLNSAAATLKGESQPNGIQTIRVVPLNVSLNKLFLLCLSTSDSNPFPCTFLSQRWIIKILNFNVELLLPPLQPFAVWMLLLDSLFGVTHSVSMEKQGDHHYNCDFKKLNTSPQSSRKALGKHWRNLPTWLVKQTQMLPVRVKVMQLS